MPEVVAESKVLTVHMKCDKCGNGIMIPTGMSLMSNPPIYPHKCNYCGYVENYNCRYPHQRIVLLEEPREPIGDERNPRF